MTSHCRHLLAVHQGAEMYGSDRSLLEVLSGLDVEHWHCTVCLPQEGPLAVALREANLTVHIVPVVKVERRLFSLRGLLGLPSQIRGSMTSLDAIAAARPVDLVYTNTLAVWAGALWAWRRGVPHVWHVREIIRRPAWVARGMRGLAQRLSRRLICNSEQTRDWLDSGVSARQRRSVVVWNGVKSSDMPTDEQRSTARRALGVDDDTVLVLMVGRVNSWKGHDLLLDAIELLPARVASGFKLLLVGGPPPGEPDRMRALQARVEASPLSDCIQVHGFSDDVSPFYAAADVSVVPSREPEPFGRVAIEAMAAGVPVIAANHGGLSEIVSDGDSGLLVPPNDEQALADALSRMIGSRDDRHRMGQQAKCRQAELFSLAAYRSKVAQVLQEAL
jgi:glycosyltransferase involved in cell wall biosynthesis